METAQHKMSIASAEWKRMIAIHPPNYICVRRKSPAKSQKTNTEYTPLHLDGKLDKEEWAHVEWSNVFQDIEGPQKLPKAHVKTRFKMMYDDQFLYIGAELEESKLWGTYTIQNSRMYDENDFEVFLNPDGTRHNYYELEMNCLNTIWELVLHKPYKDGHALTNPYNLHSTKSAVHLQGDVNAPGSECSKWSIEVRYALDELVQFDTIRNRLMRAGDVWRVNYSRVQYELETVNDNGIPRYVKKPNCREDNIVWAPTGVIDIHRPEKWGIVFFASDSCHSTGSLEFQDTQERYLNEQLAIERVLDTIYYEQREFYAKHAKYATCLDELRGFKVDTDAPQASDSPSMDLYTELEDDFKRFAPRITIGATTEHVGKRENEYCASISTATEEWNILQDGKLWPTCCSP
uniref:Uncharacterized protein AlNc14C64G4589 n=1 Tax=Albugo laibachii Nc14 TaxID=890382 RepID=F0WD69_9STRA|nr:conserved hypothetical protein [Albugo laibachii Nc14]|eukprot:CCA19141.1 conserved hypothetical protein [Albugo laibachii Nc14]